MRVSAIRLALARENSEKFLHKREECALQVVGFGLVFCGLSEVGKGEVEKGF